MKVLRGAVALLLGLAVVGFGGGAAIADDPPRAAVGDLVVREPNKNGAISAQIPVVLDRPAPAGVTIAWSISAGSAGGADLTLGSGSVAVPVGAVAAAIPVTIHGDRAAEADETAAVTITATGAAVADATGTITIRNAAAGLTVGDLTVLEPDAGVARVHVPVTLADSAKRTVQLTWRVGTGPTATTAIAAGQRVALLPVDVAGDTAPEPVGALAITITGATGASIADGVGQVTVLDDDVDPFGWAPPVGSVPATGTAVYVQSSAGDYVGQGRTYSYTPADAAITVSASGGVLSVRIHGDERWSADFSREPGTGVVTTGYWTEVGRHPFAQPGLTFTGEGRGCNEVLGRFIVDDVAYGSAGQIQRATVRFEQRCERTGPPLLGFIRYDAADPTTPPPPGDPSAFAWSPPPGAVPDGTHLYFESPAGEWIGQGQTRLLTPADATFTVTEASGVVRLRVVVGQFTEWWDLSLSGPDAQTQLAAGLYEDLQRYPFHNPVEGGLSFGGTGRGCNTLAGGFAVDDVVYDAEGLASFRGRFVQRCEGTGLPLHGSVRWSRP